MIVGKNEIEPLHDIVIVKRRTQGDKTSSGLYVPPTSVGDQVMADVLAVGPGRYERGERVPMTVRAGDVVVLDTVAGYKLEIEGEKLTIVREAEIIAIVRNAS